VGGVRERVLRMKKMEVHYTYTYEDNIMKPTKHSLKKRLKGEGNGNIMEWMSIFKVCCARIWNHHIEITS
jgi:hypothetical protein